MRPPLTTLERRIEFLERHIGPNEDDVAAMLETLGFPSLDTFIQAVLPPGIASDAPLGLPAPLTERAVLTELRGLRERNRVFINMIGMGYYGTVMPHVIKRNVLENPGWYTAYTPYQAEISQGRLEVLLAFQQMTCELTGMAIANASLLDEATAAAEAMTLLRRVSRNPGGTFLVERDCHPQTLAVLRTRAEPLGIDIRLIDFDDPLPQDAYAVLLGYPGSSGAVRDLAPLIERAHAADMLAAVASDPLALMLLKAPGEMGADVVFGSAQRFGVSMSYGGPHAAFFATRDEFKRSLPGRIIGVSIDRDGNSAYRMALQTREQHIRREKATSNICTAQVLLAVIATFYAIYHGPKTLKRIAARTHRLTQIMAEGLRRLGHEVVTQSYFDTVKVRVPGQAGRYAAKARAARINLRVYDGDHLGISFDETIRRQELLDLWQVFSPATGVALDIDRIDAELKECLAGNLRRKRAVLTHPIFNAYHTETEMLRYIRRLQLEDVALDRSMIPLGSCTMKLNAAIEMQALSYRELAAMHPFAPLDQSQGYQQLFEALEEQLCAVTGFDAVSLQPNAGSQGEYAGLLVIRRYLQQQGQAQRDICLIPASAHGTNPASAVMAGLEVKVVDCDEGGNVDVGDLRDKAERYADRLAALMITYPSTHGVFERNIREICEVVHDHGGQVYMDGANLNALVGISKPAELGADVMHVNLHKTFCIPHGGGGPGMGPIGVKAHLAPYLPDHPVVEGTNPAAGPGGTIGSVSAAPWGSASILAISWAYIRLMGDEGLRQATRVAILNANYVAERLKGHFPILYTGHSGYVAHECIIDIRPIKAACGIDAQDIAKRLIDYGFHAPTVSFPVMDTMMIEPTESETRAELDRFCDALIAIRAEIAEVESGEAARDDNLLVNAPHTVDMLTAPEWRQPYDRERAFFPLPYLRANKYWPPVRRVDELYGDRNLVCTCPPLDDYRDAAERPKARKAAAS